MFIHFHDTELLNILLYAEWLCIVLYMLLSTCWPEFLVCAQGVGCVDLITVQISVDQSFSSSDYLFKQQFSSLQKPRICILGGGFGGLYTALRLESLVWPDDKKPQVSWDSKLRLLFE